MKALIPILILLSMLNRSLILGQKSDIELSGDILQIALPSAALASTFIWRDGQQAGWQFALTMSTSIVLTHGYKRIINKPRPNGGKHAFPSGHTSSAFTGAAFIQRRYGWQWGIPAYLLAGYTGWTRVMANKHDYWDVLGGAIVGIGSAYLFTKPLQKSSLGISFGKSQGYYLLDLNYHF